MSAKNDSVRKRKWFEDSTLVPEKITDEGRCWEQKHLYYQVCFRSGDDTCSDWIVATEIEKNYPAIVREWSNWKNDALLASPVDWESGGEATPSDLGPSHFKDQAEQVLQLVRATRVAANRSFDRLKAEQAVASLTSKASIAGVGGKEDVQVSAARKETLKQEIRALQLSNDKLKVETSQIRKTMEQSTGYTNKLDTYMSRVSSGLVPLLGRKMTNRQLVRSFAQIIAHVKTMNGGERKR